MSQTPVKATSSSVSDHSLSHDTAVADAIRDDLVNYGVALRQAAQHLQELDITLEGLEREEELDVAMWSREEARSSADERAVAARIRRAGDHLRDLDDRLADVLRSYPQHEDYARDIHEIEAEIAKLSQEEADALKELTKASTLLSVLQTRRNEARSDELRAIEKVRFEADQLTSRVYQRPSSAFAFRRYNHAQPSPSRSGVAANNDSPHPPVSRSPLPPFDPESNRPADGDPALSCLPPRRPPQPVPAVRRVGPMLAASEGGWRPLLLTPWQLGQLHALFESHGQSQVCRLRELIDADPSVVKRVDAQGNTPLHMACAARPPSLAVVDELVMAGAPLRTFNSAGLTPFHVACLNTADGLSGELKSFLVGSVGYNVGERTSNGETAAHLLAADDCHLASMHFLLREGCSLHDRANISGRWCTPADVAFLSGPNRASRMQELLQA